MKRFIADQITFILLVVLVFVILPSSLGLDHPIFLVLQLLMLGMTVYLCHPLFLLLIDLCLPKVERELFFCRETSQTQYEFFKKHRRARWKFISRDHILHMLTIPDITHAAPDHRLPVPPHDVPLLVTYYRYSKILVKWEIKKADASQVSNAR